MLSTLSVCGRADGTSPTAEMVRLLADFLGPFGPPTLLLAKFEILGYIR